MTEVNITSTKINSKIRVKDIWKAAEVLDILHWLTPKVPQCGHERFKIVEDIKLDAIGIVDYIDFGIDYSRILDIDMEQKALKILRREIDFFIDMAKRMGVLKE